MKVEPQDVRTEGAGCSSVIVPRASGVMALSECSLKVVLPGGAANEKGWERPMAEEPPIHTNTYELGQDPSTSKSQHPRHLLLQESIVLSCSDCRGEGGLSSWLAQGPEAAVLGS